MSNDFGLTSDGLVIKSLVQIQAEIDEALRTAFGPAINTTPQSIIGQLRDIMADREADLWELMESIHKSQYPNSAEGNNLDDVSSINSLTRLEPLPSNIVGQALFGTPGTIIPIGTVFSVDTSPSSRFATVSEVILVVGVDEIQDISFDAVPTSGTFKLQYKSETTIAINWDDVNTDIEDALNNLNGLSGVTVAGTFAAGFTITFAGSDGKQEQVLLISVDNTLDAGGAVVITITETTPGEYQGQVNCEAEDTGPTVANADTVTVIETPVSGLNSTFNPEDAVIGRNLESDSAFRLRRTENLQTSRSGPIDAIRANILDLNLDTEKTQLEAVTVVENFTNVINAQGMPPKSVRTIVYQAGGVTDRDDDIGQALWDSKSGGIETFGAIPITVTDSQGIDHIVNFDRPTEVNIYLELDLTVDSNYPVDGDSQVENIMVEWGNGLGTGTDVVVYPSLVGQLNAVPGIIDVVVRIGTAPAPVSDDNINIDDGTGGDVEISRWDTGRITVTQV